MLKRVDVATYNFFKAAKDGSWKGGFNVFGVKEGRRRLEALDDEATKR